MKFKFEILLAIYIFHYLVSDVIEIDIVIAISAI